MMQGIKNRVKQWKIKRSLRKQKLEIQLQALEQIERGNFPQGIYPDINREFEEEFSNMFKRRD
jgi:hypothetical protein